MWHLFAGNPTERFFGRWKINVVSAAPGPDFQVVVAGPHPDRPFTARAGGGFVVTGQAWTMRVRWRFGTMTGWGTSRLKRRRAWYDLEEGLTVEIGADIDYLKSNRTFDQLILRLSSLDDALNPWGSFENPYNFAFVRPAQGGWGTSWF